MDASDEPLNLTLKKMPIAIVAPFSVVDPKTQNNNNDARVLDLNKRDDDVPQDLSLKTKSTGLDLSKKSYSEKSNLNRNFQLHNYFCKDEETSRLYDRNTFVSDTCSDKNPSPDIDKDNFYAFLNSLDGKFLSVWYMNSILNQQNPYLNLNGSTYRPKSDTSPGSNKILNNLLDKKPYTSYKFPVDFDALIKNEMQPEKNEVKG